jgi:hypothetical protein
VSLDFDALATGPRGVLHHAQSSVELSFVVDTDLGDYQWGLTPPHLALTDVKRRSVFHFR